MDIQTAQTFGHQLLDNLSIGPILRDFQSGLRKIYGPNTPRLILYGSYARGEARPDSDIDLLLLFANEIKPGLEIRRLSGLLADLNLLYAALISAQPFSDHEYQNGQGPFWCNVRRDGIELYGL